MLNYDHETLPEQWSNLTQTQVIREWTTENWLTIIIWLNRQIDSLGKLLAANSEFIDWRQWLLAASAPFPFPTQSQLLELLQKYRSLTDLDTPKLIDRNAFNKVILSSSKFSFRLMFIKIEDSVMVHSWKAQHSAWYIETAFLWSTFAFDQLLVRLVCVSNAQLARFNRQNNYNWTDRSKTGF